MPSPRLDRLGPGVHDHGRAYDEVRIIGLRRGPVPGEGYRTLEDMPAVTRAHDREEDRESEPGVRNRYW
jgi:hypothetical protein